MSRRKLREHLFKMVYLFAFSGAEELDEQIDLYLANIEHLEEADRLYLQERFSALLARVSDIDAILNETAKGWRTDRFGSCELAIMRVAVYEIMYDAAVPESVAINEAVELTKAYGGEGSHGFVNGILGEIVRQHG